jgi:TctA family transporter
LRQSLIASGGNPLILVQWPIATILMALAVILLLIPFIRLLRSRGRARTAALEAETIGTAID